MNSLTTSGDLATGESIMLTNWSHNTFGGHEGLWEEGDGHGYSPNAKCAFFSLRTFVTTEPFGKKP
jgi:hypothetical protein